MSIAIYNNFLTELWRLRLIAARETVEVINSAESTISGDIGQTPIKLAAEVCGLGPIFQLFLIIENMSATKIASDLCVLLKSNQRHYKLQMPYQKVKLGYYYVNSRYPIVIFLCFLNRTVALNCSPFSIQN